MSKNIIFFAIAIIWFILMFVLGDFRPSSEVELSDVISEGVTIILIAVWMFATQRLKVSDGARNIMSIGFLIMLLAMIPDFADELKQAPDNIAGLLLIFEAFYPLGFALATVGLLTVVFDNTNSLPDADEEVDTSLSVNTDAITGLWTRDYMQNHLRSRIEDDFALVFVKMTDFKAISVKYDSSTSLTLLRAMTRSLKKSLMSKDRGFRYGKDVFVLFLDGKSTAQGIELANQLQATFADISVNAGDETLTCDTQIGVIESVKGEKVFDLVQRGIQKMNQTATNKVSG